MNSYQKDRIEYLGVKGRLIDASMAADVLPGTVHHVGDGQFGNGHSRCWLGQLGQSRADITVFYRRQTHPSSMTEARVSPALPVSCARFQYGHSTSKARNLTFALIFSVSSCRDLLCGLHPTAEFKELCHSLTCREPKQLFKLFIKLQHSEAARHLCNVC